MNRVIVTTTINHPTEAIALFDTIAAFRLIVIGNKQTSADFSLRRGLCAASRDDHTVSEPTSSVDYLQAKTQARKVFCRSCVGQKRNVLELKGTSV